jgi:hypothetical protein
MTNGPMVLTEEQRETAYKAARSGLSLTGVAHLVGRSRAWLSKVRTQYPDFDERLMRELALYEQELTDKLKEALDGGAAALVAAIVKARSNRFPQRHSDVPQMRYSHETQCEERNEDAPNVKVADSSGPEMRAMLKTFLEAEMKRRDGE